MAINRYELVSRHNPVLEALAPRSPLSVGNGEFAFTADVTGLQSLYEAHLEKGSMPLCTMSQWGWHTEPDKDGKHYTLEDVDFTEYDCLGRKVHYAVERTERTGHIYDWLRVNPHRLNLAKIGLIWDNRPIAPKSLSHIRQELHLYTGILESQFKINGIPVVVKVCVHPFRDVLAAEITSEALKTNRLALQLQLPYGNPDITASDWTRDKLHTTRATAKSEDELTLLHELDRDAYYITLCGDSLAQGYSEDPEQHAFRFNADKDNFFFTAEFSPKKPAAAPVNTSEAFAACEAWWRDFWEKGAAIRLRDSKDARAYELERRIILSQYLLAVNSAGSLPPQETGLICNSWYGKFHTEMHLWHSAHFPLWNRSSLLERSLSWYRDHIKEAQTNAARNGYAGARWPKMAAYDAVDSPSKVATVLIWQQPHILYMLELCFKAGNSTAFLKEYWDTVRETADFMASFAQWDSETGRYILPSPLIPVQESHRPRDTVNPAFELEYWRFGLKIALLWSERLGLKAPESWSQVVEKMAKMSENSDFYLAHEKCPETFERFNNDHPSMVGTLGLLDSERVDPEKMRRTLHKILECWKFETSWGWDFAMLAMTAVRLGEPETAVSVLMRDTVKNQYEVNGNNHQIIRNDLPAYLPGNGSLLLAIPLMVAGNCGGFPKDGSWKVEAEGFLEFPAVLGG